MKKGLNTDKWIHTENKNSVNVTVLKMVPNTFYFPKRWGLSPLALSLDGSSWLTWTPRNVARPGEARQLAPCSLQSRAIVSGWTTPRPSLWRHRLAPGSCCSRHQAFQLAWPFYSWLLLVEQRGLLPLCPFWISDPQTASISKLLFFVVYC